MLACSTPLLQPMHRLRVRRASRGGTGATLLLLCVPSCCRLCI